MKILDLFESSMQKTACGNCRYFQNDPTFVEVAYPGLTVFSSGYASVRDQDGLCSQHQLYLSARDTCTNFALATQECG